MTSNTQNRLLFVLPGQKTVEASTDKSFSRHCFLMDQIRYPMEAFHRDLLSDPDPWMSPPPCGSNGMAL